LKTFTAPDTPVVPPAAIDAIVQPPRAPEGIDERTAANDVPQHHPDAPGADTFVKDIQSAVRLAKGEKNCESRFLPPHVCSFRPRGKRAISKSTPYTVSKRNSLGV